MKFNTHSAQIHMARQELTVAALSRKADNMHDIHRLSKDLRQSEHETAQVIFKNVTGAGYTTEKAVSLVYRAGIIDGRKLERERAERNAYHTHRLAMERQASPPEAINETVDDSTALEEGSNISER